MKKVVNSHPQFWRREAEFFRNIQQKFKADIEQLINQAEGVHTFQIMYGCEWDDHSHGSSGFFQCGFDGENFLAFDLKTESWTTPTEVALRTKQKLDSDYFFNKYLKQYLTFNCVDSLKNFVNYNWEALRATVFPLVSLLQKNSSSPVTCHATGFFPDKAHLFWRKDGVELHEGVDKGEILLNNGGTFQMSIDLKLSSVSSKDWRRYDCVFQFFGANKSIIKKLDKEVIKTNKGTFNGKQLLE
ncbi:major histocompatibility complex class I-related gene protein-like [Pholidichthys leucotaenia]